MKRTNRYTPSNSRKIKKTRKENRTSKRKIILSFFCYGYVYINTKK